MPYFVTYAFMDGELGANPFRHAFLLLSRLEEGQDKIEVVENWGFYGVPSTMSPSTVETIKKKIGLDIDLTGNHGILRHEEMRYLDQGKGLKGKSFELSKEQFESLQRRCKTMEQGQYAAIQEVTTGFKGKQPYRHYPQESLSKHIYAIEKAKAEEEKREPRLSPFEIRYSLFSCLNRSYTCKSLTMKLLDGILSKEQLAGLSKHGWNQAIPRYSGPMESIFLHSVGPLKPYTKRSGETVYNRDDKNPETKLYWTIPPQEVDFLNESTKAQFSLPADYIDEAKSAVKRLQALEWLFYNAPIDSKYKIYTDGIVEKIKSLYSAFSDSHTDKTAAKATGVEAYFLRLLHLPSNHSEQGIAQRVKAARYFFNALYMTMVDDERIDDSIPCELDIEESYDGKYNPLESLACHLPQKFQKQLCRVIGRTYVKPEALAVNTTTVTDTSHRIATVDAAYKPTLAPISEEEAAGLVPVM